MASDLNQIDSTGLDIISPAGSDILADVTSACDCGCTDAECCPSCVRVNIPAFVTPCQSGAAPGNWIIHVAEQSVIVPFLSDSATNPRCCRTFRRTAILVGYIDAFDNAQNCSPESYVETYSPIVATVEVSVCRTAEGYTAYVAIDSFSIGFPIVFGGVITSTDTSLCPWPSQLTIPMSAEAVAAGWPEVEVTVDLLYTDCDDCPDCCTDIEAVISGLTGDCGDYFNGAYILNKFAGVCEWFDGSYSGKVSIIRPRLTGVYIIKLYKADVFMGLSEEIEMGVDGCLPDGTYAITFYNGNICTGQTGTITIACSDIIP